MKKHTDNRSDIVIMVTDTVDEGSGVFDSNGSLVRLLAQPTGRSHSFTFLEQAKSVREALELVNSKRK